MTLDQLELYSAQLAKGVVEITEELHEMINEVRNNEAIYIDCDEAWEHVKSELIKAMNEVNNEKS
jgi:hypothetical protein|tara:strand:- start:318 stop:512 length:195 start_codon:yes stop_codon:yes gene_type:complete